MKKEIMLLLVIVSSAMVLSAAGKQDDVNEQSFGRSAVRGGMMGNSPRSDVSRDDFFEQRDAVRDEYIKDLEILTINGSLILVNGELPSIENNGVKYTLMAPLLQVQDLNLENGMNISVDGYEMPGQPLQWDSAEKSIMVTKAVINGEEIEIDHDAGTFGMMGNGGLGGANRMMGNTSRGGFGGPGRNGTAANNGMMGRRS